MDLKELSNGLKRYLDDRAKWKTFEEILDVENDQHGTGNLGCYC